jgi:type IV pilus assembly protein PilC
MGQKKKASRKFDNYTLSVFCLQLSLIVKSDIRVWEGLRIMSEDADAEWEKKLFLDMAEDMEDGLNGRNLSEELKKSGAFPDYLVRMTHIGEESGNLDVIMKELASYYEKEDRQAEALKNALTYPAMLIFMLLVVLYVLFSRVMPVFEDVYEQLGSALSPVTKSAMNFGKIASGAALVVLIVLLILSAVLYLLAKYGIRPEMTEKLIRSLKSRSKISLAIAKRRFTAVLALTLKGGTHPEEGYSLAESVVDNPEVRAKLRKGGELMKTGGHLYDALKSTGLFSGFHIQMVNVAENSGHLDSAMAVISADCEEQSEKAMDAFISGFEPTVVAVLAVCVGLVLLSVMLPLAGLLSSIGG